MDKNKTHDLIRNLLAIRKIYVQHCKKKKKEQAVPEIFGSGFLDLATVKISAPGTGEIWLDQNDILVKVT